MAYNKKTWANGDLITKESMNNIENGIYKAHDEIETLKNNTPTGGSNINDTTASATTTYSSNKIEAIKEDLSSQISTSGGNINIPENVALIMDVAVDETTEDYIPLMSLNGTEYRLTINDSGVPIVKDSNGNIVFTCGTGGSSSGGDTGGSEGGDTGDTGGWTNGVAYTLTNIENSYVTETGQIASYNGWNRTDYVNCAGASKITISGATASSNYNCFFNLNKKFISKFAIAANVANEISVPSDACYFILSSSDNYSNITAIPYE